MTLCSLNIWRHTCKDRAKPNKTGHINYCNEIHDI